MNYFFHNQHLTICANCIFGVKKSRRGNDGALILERVWGEDRSIRLRCEDVDESVYVKRVIPL